MRRLEKLWRDEKEVYRISLNCDMVQKVVPTEILERPGSCRGSNCLCVSQFCMKHGTNWALWQLAREAGQCLGMVHGERG